MLRDRYLKMQSELGSLLLASWPSLAVAALTALAVGAIFIAAVNGYNHATTCGVTLGRPS